MSLDRSPTIALIGWQSHLGTMLLKHLHTLNVKTVLMSPLTDTNVSNITPMMSAGIEGVTQPYDTVSYNPITCEIVSMADGEHINIDHIWYVFDGKKAMDICQDNIDISAQVSNFTSVLGIERCVCFFTDLAEMILKSSLNPSGNSR